MTIKRSTLIEGILIICMVAVLGLVTAIREPAAEKNQVKTIEEPKVETANIYILKKHSLYRDVCSWNVDR